MPSFLQKDKEYRFLSTAEDTVKNLKDTGNLYPFMRAAAEVAGQIALRLTHDHELFLDFERYDDELLNIQEKFSEYDEDVKVRRAPSAPNPWSLLWSHVLVKTLLPHHLPLGHESIARCDLN